MYTSNNAVLVFDRQTLVGESQPFRIMELDRAYQAIVSGTGAVSATVEVQVSNDGINWLLLGTITLSGANTDTDGFVSQASWKYTKMDITAIAGVGASVTAYIGT